MLERFFSDGFVVVPGACSERACNDGLRVVNKSLETAEPGNRDKRVFSDPALVDLFNRGAGLRQAAAELLGVRPEQLPYMAGAQVALRFPGTLCDDADPPTPLPFWNAMWHIDGLPSPENGVAEGSISNFTLLVGVCLRDATGEFEGNLVVYPRSHWATQDYFRAEGFAQAKRGLTELPPLPLAEPVQLRLRKGDAVLAHYSLAHSIAPNAGHEIRTMVYIRLNMRGGGFEPAPMLDVWADYCPRLQQMGRAAGNDNNAGPAVARAAGYVDLVARTGHLRQQREQDARRREQRSRAEALLGKQQWAEALPLMQELAAAAPRDVLLQLQLGMCLTAGDRKRLPEGEAVLRALATDAAPSLAAASVFLARNLLRQAEELGQPGKRTEAALFASRGLLELPPAPDVAVEAVKILAEAQAPELPELAARAARRFPALSEQLLAAAAPDSAAALWAEGRRWLATEPKSLSEGRAVFGRLVAALPGDYWARILLGSCTLASGEPAEAAAQLRPARALDPNGPAAFFPHSFVVLAQALAAGGRGEEAVAQIEAMLDARLVLGEPDHADKIVEALQVCADVLLPTQQLRFERIRAAAAALFPALEPRLMAVSKQQTACALQ